jgi:mono/diheme cytochrome c family protein
MIARGKALWFNCQSCHGAFGEGAQLGPNLRDDYWLKGSDMRDLIRSIGDGATAKGMPQWRLVQGITRDDIRALAAYVVSLHGTENGSGKPPEGKLQPITY